MEIAPPPVSKVARKFLGAELHKERKSLRPSTSMAPVVPSVQVLCSAYPSDPVVPTSYECFCFFHARLRDVEAHALANTCASENLMNAARPKTIQSYLMPHRKAQRRHPKTPSHPHSPHQSPRLSTPSQVSLQRS